MHFHRFRLEDGMCEFCSEFRTALRLEWSQRREFCLNRVRVSDSADVDLCPVQCGSAAGERRTQGCWFLSVSYISSSLKKLQLYRVVWHLFLNKISLHFCSVCRCFMVHVSMCRVSVNNLETQADLNSWRQLHRLTCSATWSPEHLTGFPMATVFLFVHEEK